MAYKDLDSTRSLGEPWLPFVLSPSLVPAPAAAASRRWGPVVMRRTPAAATILAVDSGLGGLPVVRGLVTSRPEARLGSAADAALFPCGRMDAAACVARVVAVMEWLIAAHAPDVVVIACYTASTLVLPALRARFGVPFVGTVAA